jgi:hypothetical protein
LDRKRCQDLSIRSLIAVPVRFAENVIGIIEVFSQSVRISQKRRCDPAEAIYKKADFAN